MFLNSNNAKFRQNSSTSSIEMANVLLTYELKSENAIYFEAQTRCLETERKAEEKIRRKEKYEKCIRKAPLSALGVLR